MFQKDVSKMWFIWVVEFYGYLKEKENNLTTNVIIISFDVSIIFPNTIWNICTSGTFFSCTKAIVISAWLIIYSTALAPI